MMCQFPHELDIIDEIYEYEVKNDNNWTAPSLFSNNEEKIKLVSFMDRHSKHTGIRLEIVSDKVIRDNAMTMIACRLVKPLELLCNKKFDDDDINENIQYIKEKLEGNLEDVTYVKKTIERIQKLIFYF